eukprot:1161809-Pelagomonas_calceolata.AAC.6
MRPKWWSKGAWAKDTMHLASWYCAIALKPDLPTSFAYVNLQQERCEAQNSLPECTQRPVSSDWTSQVRNVQYEWDRAYLVLYACAYASQL